MLPEICDGSDQKPRSRKLQLQNIMYSASRLLVCYFVTIEFESMPMLSIIKTLLSIVQFWEEWNI